MIIEAVIMQMFIDNYQGGSGLPTKAKVLVDIPDDTKAVDIFDKTREKLHKTGIKGSFHEIERVFPIESVLSINILREI